MTATQPIIGTWATGAFGKTARALMAIGGMATAVILMLLAPFIEQAWLVVLMAATLVVSSVRAARYPTFVRLAVLMVNLLVITTIAVLI